MRSRRFLLVSTALSSASLVLACKKESVEQPPVANPKGSIYDRGAQDAGQAPEPTPGNPKGSTYDLATAPPKPLAAETDAGATDAGDAGVTKAPNARPEPPPPPKKIPPPGNPKGSHYDHKPPPPPPAPVKK